MNGHKTFRSNTRDCKDIICKLNNISNRTEQEQHNNITNRTEWIVHDSTFRTRINGSLCYTKNEHN